MMAAENSNNLTFIGLVLFVACGLIVFIVLVIFVKRQIARFAFLSKYDPHVPIGSSISRFFKRDIMMRLAKTKDIRHIPTLLSEDAGEYDDGTTHFYRMKVVDLNTKLKVQLQNEPASQIKDHEEALGETGREEMREFVQLYKRARHNPQVFTEDHYKRCEVLVESILLRLLPPPEDETLLSAGVTGGRSRRKRRSGGENSQNLADSLISATAAPFRRLARFTKKKAGSRTTTNQYEAVPNDEC